MNKKIAKNAAALGNMRETKSEICVKIHFSPFYKGEYKSGTECNCMIS